MWRPLRPCGASAEDMTATHRLVARQASKTFGSTKVLSDAELLVEPGEIHALIGQNGSGKSTLVKILTGYHAPDPGMTLTIDSEPVQLPVSWDAISAAGVAVVHQDLGLRDDATVAENIGVGGFVCSRWLRKIDIKAQREVARTVLGRLGADIDPVALTGTLSATQRAVVGIARALRDQRPGGGVIILDEATRALPRDELVHFHALLKRVVAEGTSVIIVTHNLEEVLTLADRVTILRDGRVMAGGLDTSTLTEHEMAKLMLGQTVSTGQRPEPCPDGPVVARLDEVVVSAGLAPVDLQITAGEIVGVTGLAGGPHELLPYVVGGAKRGVAGTLTVADQKVVLAHGATWKALRAGVVLVPERRERDGLAFELSIRDNIALPSLRKRSRTWFTGVGWQERLTDSAIKTFSIKARDGDILIKELSGGNQQKVLFAKWMSVGPALLVLHEPTQAVDVGARRDILDSIQAAARSGVAVLLVSGEVTDLVEICHRIVVMGPSGHTHEVQPETPDDLVDAVYATTTSTGD